MSKKRSSRYHATQHTAGYTCPGHGISGFGQAPENHAASMMEAVCNHHRHNNTTRLGKVSRNFSSDPIGSCCSTLHLQSTDNKGHSSKEQVHSLMLLMSAAILPLPSLANTAFTSMYLHEFAYIAMQTGSEGHRPDWWHTLPTLLCESPWIVDCFQACLKQTSKPPGSPTHDA